jgi:hypothetical protein
MSFLESGSKRDEEYLPFTIAAQIFNKLKKRANSPN